MVAEAGVGPPDRLALPVPARTKLEGETAFAAESPELAVVIVTWNDCPTLTRAAETAKELANAAGVCTVTVAAGCVVADSARAEFTSVPETVLEKVTAPATVPWNVQPNTCVP